MVKGSNQPETERGGLPILHLAGAAALEAWLEKQPAEHKCIWLKIANASMLRSSKSASSVIGGW